MLDPLLQLIRAHWEWYVICVSWKRQDSFAVWEFASYAIFSLVANSVVCKSSFNDDSSSVRFGDTTSALYDAKSNCKVFQLVWVVEYKVLNYLLVSGWDCCLCQENDRHRGFFTTAISLGLLCSSKMGCPLVDYPWAQLCDMRDDTDSACLNDVLENISESDVSPFLECQRELGTVN